MKKYLWAICYGFALTAFTAYITLDTFVLSDTYQTDTTQMNTSIFENISGSSVESESVDTEISGVDDSNEQSSAHRRSDSHGSTQKYYGEENNDDADISSSESSLGENNSYSDDNISITLTEYYENNTKIYVADVMLTSAEYLKTAFADDTYGKNVTAKTSSIAEAHNAIFAVNGDYYGAQERGYVIRNGILYRDIPGDNNVLCIYADGTMKVVDPKDYTAEELAEQGVWQAFSFGPGVVENGNVSVSQDEEVGKAMASNPRTAVGLVDSNHFVFVVSDGRTNESEGLSLYELAQFMQSLGAKTAYNLDGGGSSAMYFNGQIINNPTTNGSTIKERGVSDIVYIG